MKIMHHLLDSMNRVSSPTDRCSERRSVAIFSPLLHIFSSPSLFLCLSIVISLFLFSDQNSRFEREHFPILRRRCTVEDL
uniref:Uncharacterized protein n=1 Tax=Noccaea caerulescens TaxID=107243 RepID=A0A1J3JYR9_NOCCA